MLSEEWSKLRYGDVVRWKGPDPGPVCMLVGPRHGSMLNATPYACILRDHKYAGIGHVLDISVFPDLWELVSGRWSVEP